MNQVGEISRERVVDPRDRVSLWRTELFGILALLLYVGLVELIVLAVNPRFEGAALLLVSILLAAVPAAIWLLLFYRQDRLEPEPKHYVLKVALLAGLLAGAVAHPLIVQFYDVAGWIGRSALVEILGGILVVGALQEFLKYAAVRYSVYYTREFDQRVDGVVYGSAAGLGFAAMLNVIYVVQTGGVDLGVGVIRIVVTQMVAGALGALLGYFLGRNKIDRMPIWWMPLGVVLAATINGLFVWLSGEITRAPIRLSAAGSLTAGYNPWPSLALAAGLAALLLGLVFYLVRRNLRADLAAPAGAPAPGAAAGTSQA